MGWPEISGFMNGERVDSTVLNRPVNQLAERTDYLYSKLNGLVGTVFVDGELDAVSPPVVGDVVYRTPAGAYAKAIAMTQQNDVFYAAVQAMAVGVVISVTGTSARILLAGRAHLSQGLSVLSEDPAHPVSGRGYLSSRVAGKVTDAPLGPVIYIGSYIAVKDGTDVLVNPQYHDTGESHVHRAFKITGRPRGPVHVSDGVVSTIDAYSAGNGPAYEEHGWYVATVDGKKALQLDLQYHPETLRFIAPLPFNSVALTVDGVDARHSALFGGDGEWNITNGRYLNWYARAVDGVLPFALPAGSAPVAHSLVLYTAKSCVGPSGFVTSLSVAKGSPLRIVGTSTEADAHQGDLQIGMDVDFSTDDADVAGYKVVKEIVGSTFRTGPVVESISVGPGLSVSASDGRGHGAVTISFGDTFTGEFETIALENAKQALVGGFFPYTRLLGWSGTGADVNTAFTAKFRVPEHLPVSADRPGYNVVVSMSVFGESDAPDTAYAGVSLTSGVLADYIGENISGGFGGVSRGPAYTLDIPFEAGYRALDPVYVSGTLVDGVEEDAQHVRADELLLKGADGAPVVVKPGWFVGIRLARCAPVNASQYTGALGFVSMRWKLVAAR